MKNIFNALRKNSDNLALFVVFFFCMCVASFLFLSMINSTSTPLEIVALVVMSCAYLLTPVVVLIISWEK